MSEPIKEGDIVQVVRDSCGCHVGSVFVVDFITPSPLCTGIICDLCGANTPFSSAYAVREGVRAYPVSWLKRLPPLDELESEQRDEKLTEPA